MKNLMFKTSGRISFYKKPIQRKDWGFDEENQEKMTTQARSLSKEEIEKLIKEGAIR